MWESSATLHAALNDLPGALFIAFIFFRIAAKVTGRESLKSAAFWSLMASAVGAVFAVASGLRAEGVIEHGSAMHRYVERHQTLAIGFTIFVVGLAAWQALRDTVISGKEAKAFTAVTVFALLTLLWVGSVGGKIVFQHAGGLETSVLQSSLEDREAGHAHTAGEADDHEHAPGTPEQHEHAEDGTPAPTSTAASHQHD